MRRHYTNQTNAEWTLISLFSYDGYSLIVVDNLSSSSETPTVVILFYVFSTTWTTFCYKRKFEISSQHMSRPHKLYDPSCDHWQEASKWFQEAMPSKRVKAALCSAFVRQCRSTCLFMRVYIHKQALLLPVGQEVSAAWQQALMQCTAELHTGIFVNTKPSYIKFTAWTCGQEERRQNMLKPDVAEHKATRRVYSESSESQTRVLSSWRFSTVCVYAINQHGAQDPSEWSSLHRAAVGDL